MRHKPANERGRKQRRNGWSKAASNWSWKPLDGSNGIGEQTATRAVRLAYRGRSGHRWVYTPQVVECDEQGLAVKMLAPLAVGVQVEVEIARIGNSSPDSQEARVIQCRCSADGLFLIHLAWARVAY
jgi:hypothetical protein